MTDFLAQITDFLFAIGSFLLNIVEGLVYLVAEIPKSVQFLGIVTGYIPAPLLAFALAGISICVVFMLIGR